MFYTPRVIAKNEALETALNELRQSGENKSAEERLSKDLDKIRSRYSFTDEGMAKVIEAMRDRNLAHDPEAAAALIASQMPKPEPASARSSLVSPRLDIYGMQSAKEDEKWATLHQKPWQFFEDECIAVMDEFNNQAA